MIEGVVKRLFGDGGRYSWQGAPIEELLPGTLYTTTVRRDGLPYDAQVYMGLGGLGGHFWQQDVRVLLRTGSLQHPALPTVETGGYSDSLDAAYVVTSRAPHSLANQSEVLAALRADKPQSLGHFEQLVDGLALLHSLGILHRNIWPGVVRFEQGLKWLRFSRFEMSALVENILRGAGSDHLDQQRRLFLTQSPHALLHTAPERLDELLNDDAVEYLDNGAADVFALGVMAATWFLDDVGLPELSPVGEDDLSDTTRLAQLRQQIQDVHDGLAERVHVAGRKGELPLPLASLIDEMLHRHPPSRPPSGYVGEWLLKHRDEILGLWEKPPDQRYLVLFMPRQSSLTLYQWGELVNDPAVVDGDGPAELRELIETDLSRAQIAHSPRGARGWVSIGDPDSLAAADVVLVGARFAWFCRLYRPADLVRKSLGPPWPEALLIMFVTEHARVPRVSDLPEKRALPPVDVVRSDLDPDDLDALRKGRPTWGPLIDSTKPRAAMPEWQRDWIDGFDWLMELRRAELTVATFPFAREAADLHGRRADLVEDAPRRRLLLSSSDVAAELAAAAGNEQMGDALDMVDDDEAERSEGTRVIYWDGDAPHPPRRSVGRGTVRWLDPGRIQLVRDDRSPPVPAKGMIRVSGHEGSLQSIHRQERAVTDLSMMAGLLRQFRRPHTIRGLDRSWARTSPSLKGEAPGIVQKMLTSEPFFALHGPPGTGKTTVVAHAVAAYLAENPGARILVSAQSNAALDHIAGRIVEQLKRNGVSHRALRFASAVAATDLPAPIAGLQLDVGVEQLGRSLVAHADRRLAIERDAALRAVLGEWRARLPEAGPELRLLLRSGANVVFATCEGAASVTLGQRGQLPEFDWVIIEEAAKAWPTELAIPLVQASRWTLIGDHRQLPAHRREEVEEFLDRCGRSKRPKLRELEGRLDAVRAAFDLFGGMFEREPAVARDDVPLEMLTRQFRMRRPIADVVSRAFYDGLLETDERAEARRHGLTHPSFLRDRCLVWLDTTGWDDVDERAWSNQREAELVAGLVHAMSNQVAAAHDWTEERLAVLTPYHAQRQLLEARGVTNVHTVHSFQGSEAEAVVVSLVRTTMRGGARASIGHLSKPEVANVLLSRARRLLVLVGKFDHFASAGVPYWDSICATVRELGHVVSWQDTDLVDG
jgi:hypothetical protein